MGSPIDSAPEPHFRAQKLLSSDVVEGLFAAFNGAVWTTAFFAVALFRFGDAFLAGACAFAALAALAFLRFATSFVFAAAESLRLGFVGSGVAAADSLLDAAHLFRCASAIAFLPAALNFRRFRFVVALAADSTGPAGSIARSSAILASMSVLCTSKPRMAAWMISGVSFGIVMSPFR